VKLKSRYNWKPYELLEAFSEQTPADEPAEYEVEEIEAWDKLRKQIRALENELAQYHPH
jgi:hypothetical protein